MKCRLVPISVFGKIVTGKTPDTKNKSYVGDEYLFITPNELHDGFMIDSTERKLSVEGLESIVNNTVNEGIHILVGCIGWDMGNVGIVEGKCAFNQQINAITDISDGYNPYYIYYLLSGKKELFRKVAGVTRTPILNKSTFENIEVPVLEKEEQDKIAWLLKSIDEKINLNKKKINTLETMAKTLYDYWFVQFDFPDDNGHPYKTSGGKMEWNETLSREIPTGWEVGQVSDLGEVVAGGTPSTEYPEYFASDGIAWITPKDMSLLAGKYIFHGATDISEEGLKNSSAKLMPAGSVVYTTRAPIGYVAIAGNDVCTNQGFKSVVPKKEFGTEFVYYTLKSLEVHFKNVGNGSTFSEVSKETFSTVPICIPPRKIISYFMDTVDRLSDMQKKTQLENRKLIALRDFLLPMLMNGQVTFI